MDGDYSKIKPSNDDIFALLGEATAPKQSTAQIIEDLEQQQPEIHVNSEDFQPEEPVNPISDEQPPIQPPKPLSYYKAEAEAIIHFIDGISKAYLPTLYRKKLFTLDEYNEAKALVQRVWDRKDNVIADFTDREQYLYEKMQQLEGQVNDIPLSQAEKDIIIEPLAEVLQKHGGQTSPEGRLAFACLTVLGLRILPILSR